MRINDEPIIATSFLTKEGDLKNQCFLSRKSLFIKYRGKIEDFELEHIKGIQFKHKLLMFPLVAGGIAAPLSALALLNDFGNPWLLLSLLITGIMLIYFGYEGSPSLSVTTKVKDYDFFISTPSPSLRAFVKYARQIYFFGQKGQYFYFTLSPEEYQSLLSQNKLELSKPLHLLYYEDIVNQKGVFLSIEPLNVSADFTFRAIDNEVVPVLTGTLKPEDIIEPDS